MNEEILEVYTDASIRGSKKRGGVRRGFGILFVDTNDNEEQFSYKISTNYFYKVIYIKYDLRKRWLTPEHLEFFAFYIALEKLIQRKIKHKIHFYVDSDSVYYFVNNINKDKNGKIKTPKDITTQKLLERIKKLMTHLNIDVRSIPGHQKIYGNVIADRLASIGGLDDDCRYNKKGENGKKYFLSYHNNEIEENILT